MTVYDQMAAPAKKLWVRVVILNIMVEWIVILFSLLDVLGSVPNLKIGCHVPADMCLRWYCK
jgi:hypothetical protein